MIAHGHRTSIIGVPAFVCSAPAPARAWHDRARSVTVDRQREAIVQRDHERARRALWLNCERAPLSIVKGLTA